jgi:hypothetical protein
MVKIVAQMMVWVKSLLVSLSFGLLSIFIYARKTLLGREREKTLLG